MRVSLADAERDDHDHIVSSFAAVAWSHRTARLHQWFRFPTVADEPEMVRKMLHLTLYGDALPKCRRPEPMMRTFIALAMLAAVTLPTGAQRPGDGTNALADFDARIKAYAALRERLEKGAAALAETTKPAEIASAERTLAARVQAARHGAKRGDIFTPAIEAEFRRLLNPEMKGVGGRNTRGIIQDEGPAPAIAVAVNQPYPKNQPVGTVPPNVLAALPPLPEHVEYRFVDRHLILRDTRTNLVLDLIPHAIP